MRLEHLLSGVHEVASAEVNKKDTLVFEFKVCYQFYLFEILLDKQTGLVAQVVRALH